MAPRKKKHAEPSPDEVHRPDARSADDVLDAMTALDKIRVSIDAVAHGINRLTQAVEGAAPRYVAPKPEKQKAAPPPEAEEPEIEPEDTPEPEPEAKKPEPKKAEPKADTGPVDAESVKTALLAYAKVHGREKLVALFVAHGGTKLADVPPGRLKALKAAAEAGV
jgi:FtsZ-interacting cell division protein ZipA